MGLYLYKVLNLEIHPFKFILIALFFAVILVEPVNAFNLGSLQKSTTSNVSAGDVAIFNLLFWNQDNLLGYTISLDSVDTPEGWVILFNPSEFYLNDEPSGNIEYIYLSRLKTAVSAKIVNIYVSVPEYTLSGIYPIKIKAIAGNDILGVAYSLKQERLFSFEVSVTEGLYQNKSNINTDSKNVLVNINPMVTHQSIQDIKFSDNISFVSSEKYSKIVILFAFIFIILISWGLYKYD